MQAGYLDVDDVSVTSVTRDGQYTGGLGVLHVDVSVSVALSMKEQDGMVMSAAWNAAFGDVELFASEGHS